MITVFILLGTFKLKKKDLQEDGFNIKKVMLQFLRLIFYNILFLQFYLYRFQIQFISLTTLVSM